MFKQRYHTPVRLQYAEGIFVATLNPPLKKVLLNLDYTCPALGCPKFLGR
jgi:hypothetical protein